MTDQKELNDVRQELLSRPDQYITFGDLVERFDKIDAEYPDDNWNLLQIYSNFNILIGESTNKTPEQESVLNKIRAEIEEKYGGYDICEWFDDYDYEENDISEYQLVGSIDMVLDIIDKYRESEE